MIRGVGIVLCLETDEGEGGGLAMVGSVKLDAGLGGEDVELEVGLGLCQGGGVTEDAGLAANDEAVIVPASSLNEVSDAGFVAKVKGGIGYGDEVACGDFPFVDGEVVVGGKAEAMVADGLLALRVKVEVGVVGEIEVGGFGGRGLVGDAEIRAVLQGVGDHDGEIAWVAFVPVRTGDGELNACREGRGCPNLTMEPCFASMDVHSRTRMYGGEVMTLAIDDKAASIDAIGIAADDVSPEPVFCSGEAVVVHDHDGVYAVLVIEIAQGGEEGSIRGDFGLEPGFGISNSEEFDLFS